MAEETAPHMEAAALPSSGLSVIVLSETYQAVHYALVLASAAAAVNRPARLFFTMGACKALCTVPDQTGEPVSDTEAGGNRDGAVPSGPGWHALRPEPAHTSARAQDAAYATRGVADMETLLAACRDLGVTFLVCEAGLRALDLSEARLREDLPLRIAGAVTWLTETPPGDHTLSL